MIDSAADHHRCSCRPGNRGSQRHTGVGRHAGDTRFWRRIVRSRRSHGHRSAGFGGRISVTQPVRRPPRPRHSFRRAGPRRV